MDFDRLARDQGGIVSRAQLRAAGCDPITINSWLRFGRLKRTTYRGVYRVSGAPLDEEALTWICVLGTGSVLSYLTGAPVWDVQLRGDNCVHVTRPDRRRFDARPNLRVHRTRLEPDARTWRNGLPVTTRVETLLDCIGWLPFGEGVSLWDRSFQQRWLTRADVQRRLDGPARWGNRRLRWLLEHSLPGAEAESERRVHRLLKRAGITGWTGNLPITLDGRRFRLDVAFPELKIVIEIEGWAYHRTKERRDNDLAKLNALTRHGWRLIVLNYEHTFDDDYVLAQLLPLLAAG